MDFSPLTHLPLPHLIPRSPLSSWNWEKSSPIPDMEHQLQAPFLLRFLPCLFSAVSVGSIFSKIIHWIEEGDLITIILFVLFKTGKEMERKGLHYYQCYLVLSVVFFFSPVLMYLVLLFSFIIAVKLWFCSPDNCLDASCSWWEVSQAWENIALKLRETEEWRDVLICPSFGSMLVTELEKEPSRLGLLWNTFY